MEKQKKNSAWSYAIVFVFAVLLLIVGNRAVTGGERIFGKSSVAPVHPAKIQLVLAKGFADPVTQTEIRIHFEAELLGGKDKGKTILGSQFISSVAPVRQKEIEAGDQVLVRYTQYGEDNVWVFQEYNRSGALLGLVVFFVLMLFLFGGKKGIATVASLSLTFACIFLFFLPAILSGRNIYVTTVISCVFITLVTLILINGFSNKTFSVAIGCFGGLLVAGVLFSVMDLILRLTGVVNEESTYLMIMDSNLNLKAIMFASILIGVLGGVLDVGVSIVSSLDEIYPRGGEYHLRDVFNSGMKIGRDIISTMTNTLILVYIGSALSSTMLLMVYSNSFLELINREAIIFEVLQALIGSIGLIFTIPLTTLFYGFKLIQKPKPGGKQEAFVLEEPKSLEVSEMPEEIRRL